MGPRALVDEGIIVCVDTDDPMMFGNTMVDELTGFLSPFLFVRLLRKIAARSHNAADPAISSRCLLTAAILSSIDWA